MRVIAGDFRGRRMKSLDGDNTRPTTDKIKESMFNMIGPYFDGGTVLDLYSGSGSLAIEAVSRGAAEAFCVEKNYQAMRVIKENVALTKAEHQFHLIKADADRALKQFQESSIQFDYVFLDPPYAQQKIEQQIQQLLELELLTKQAVIVCETDKQVVLADKLGRLQCVRRQVYGITAVTIYRNED